MQINGPVLFGIDVVYAMDNFRGTVKNCITNLPGAKPMRTFGQINACFFMESIITDVARACGLSVLQVIIAVISVWLDQYLEARGLGRFTCNYLITVLIKNKPVVIVSLFVKCPSFCTLQKATDSLFSYHILRLVTLLTCWECVDLFCNNNTVYRFVKPTCTRLTFHQLITVFPSMITTFSNDAGMNVLRRVTTVVDVSKWTNTTGTSRLCSCTVINKNLLKKCIRASISCSEKLVIFLKIYDWSTMRGVI